MRGLLADVNVQGHLAYLRRLIESLGLGAILMECNLVFVTFADLGLSRELDDRSLWHYCQEHGWVLLTENRNHDNDNSLHATMQDSWQEGHLPVLTLANKGRFENSPEYSKRVATSVADILFGIVQEEYRDQPRIYVPL